MFTGYFDGENLSQVVQWFELGGSLKLDESVGSEKMVQELGKIAGLMEKTGILGLGASEPDAVRAAAATEFTLEGRTRIGASAGMKRPDSWPSRENASSRATNRKSRASDSTNEVHPLFALHRRRFRHQRRGSAEGAAGFFPGKWFRQFLRQFNEWNQHSLEDLKRAIERALERV